MDGDSRSPADVARNPAGAAPTVDRACRITC
jgi:hypothetical protein